MYNLGLRWEVNPASQAWIGGCWAEIAGEINQWKALKMSAL